MFLGRLAPPHERYTNTISKASLAVYGTWFALIVKIDDYEGEFYPATKQPTYKDIREWIKERYGFSVNSASISQTKKKHGLMTDNSLGFLAHIREQYQADIRLTPQKRRELAELASRTGLGVRGMENQIRRLIDDALFDDCERHHFAF